MAEVELVEAATVQVLVMVMAEAVGDTEQVLVMEVSNFSLLCMIVGSPDIQS